MEQSRAVVVTAMMSVALLSGCGATDAPDAVVSPTVTESVTVEPETVAVEEAETPAPSFATENEVASIIAGYEADWQETIESAGECRIKYVLASDDVLAEAERIICYAREATAGLTAENAVRDLNEVEIPPSMQDLVEETVMTLGAVSDVDLEAACGPVMSDPSGTPECDKALGSRMNSYRGLKSVLAKWGPYL